MQPFSFEAIPTSWKWTRIGEIADAVRGVAFPGDEASPEPFDGSVACLTTSGVQDEVNWKSRRFIPRKRLSNEKQILKHGDLLISTANSKEIVGKSCLVKNPKYSCTFGAFVTVFRPKPNVDPSLFAYWMRSTEVMRWCYYNSSSTTNISNLRTTELLDLELPIPETEEQKRIAAILDKADRLRRQRRFALTVSDSFLQSVFTKMFGDALTNPLNWTLEKLGTLLEIAPHIGTPRPASVIGDQLCVRVGEIGGSQIDLRNCARISLTGNELKRFLLKQQDVVFARAIGSESHLGKLSIVPKTSIPLVFDSHLMRLRTDRKKLNHLFLVHLLQTKGGRHRFMGQSRRTAVQFNINSTQIAELEIPLPPLPLQEQFATMVGKFEGIRRQQREATRQAEQLFQTLLHRAFSGTLSEWV